MQMPDIDHKAHGKNQVTGRGRIATAGTAGAARPQPRATAPAPMPDGCAQRLKHNRTCSVSDIHGGIRDLKTNVQPPFRQAFAFIQPVITRRMNSPDKVDLTLQRSSYYRFLSHCRQQSKICSCLSPATRSYTEVFINTSWVLN